MSSHKATAAKRTASNSMVDLKHKKQKTENAAAMDSVVKMIPADPSLLGIPRELRDIIYRYAIGGNEVKPMRSGKYCYGPVIMEAAPYNETGRTEQKWNSLSHLSLVCRQLNDETKLLRYEHNIFQVGHDKSFTAFLSQLKEKNKQAIHTISFGDEFYHLVPLYFDEKYTVPDGLNECIGLKKVICRVAICPTQKTGVKEFAKERNLELIDENENSEQPGDLFDFLTDSDEDY